MRFYPELTSPDLVVVRLHGAGLGNLLFVYFRAWLAASKHGVRFVEPTWFQVKFNQLRYIGTSRSRLYFSLFKRPGNPLTEACKRAGCLLGPKIPEVTFSSSSADSTAANLSVIFSGLGNFFEPLYSGRASIREKYFGMLHSGHRITFSRLRAEKYLALHVRLGDFKRADAGEFSTTETNVAMDFSTIRGLLKASVDRYPGKIRLVTDASANELLKILVPGVEVFRSSHILDEFNALVAADILVASASTFSMWAAFLGTGRVLYNTEMHWALQDCPDLMQYGYSNLAEFSNMLGTL